MFHAELHNLEEFGADRKDVEYAIFKIAKEFRVDEYDALKGFNGYAFEHYKNHNEDIDCLAILIDFLKDNKEYEKECQGSVDELNEQLKKAFEDGEISTKSDMISIIKTSKVSDIFDFGKLFLSLENEIANWISMESFYFDIPHYTRGWDLAKTIRKIIENIEKDGKDIFEEEKKTEGVVDKITGPSAPSEPERE